MLQRIKEKIKQYRLHRMIKKNSDYVKIDKTAILLPSMRLDMRVHAPEVRVCIGEGSIIGCNFIFESDTGNISVGKRTYIGGGTNLISRSSIFIGDDVTIAWGCYVYDHNSHSLNWRERVKDIHNERADMVVGRGMLVSKDWEYVKTAPIRICDKVWIGFNVIILKGVTIGEGAVVGAGAVVTKDIPPWTVVAGNPAIVKGYIEHD